MYVEFEVSDQIPASPEEIYSAWLDSTGHSKMTGSPAIVSRLVGERFEAWDGYIQGENLELESKVRIVQSWRTTDFDEKDEDSVLEILLKAHENGTLVTIRHSHLPKYGMQYLQGWIDYYFTPMKEYFNKKR